jgi:hypothetical protein
MNQRYQGDGPGGQTRKSAARAKPVAQAASTVHVKKKPQTDSEKRAARKAAEKEEQRKAAERARRRAEREKAEAALAEGTQDGKPQEATKPKGFFGKLFAPAPNMPSTAEYKKWRRVYWILIGIGIVAVAFSFMVQMYAPTNQTLMMIILGCAYAPIIGAFIVDFRKVKPLLRDHQRTGTGNKSPKQIKHEQEAKERAEAIEAARKAAREVKKLQKRKKPSDAIVPGEDQ